MVPIPIHIIGHIHYLRPGSSYR